MTHAECETRPEIRKLALLCITEDLIEISTHLKHSDAATDRQLSLLLDGAGWLRKRLERNEKETADEPVSG